MSINDKQRAFINEYLTNGHNASAAYKTAYPDCNGGWERLGHRLMINDDIKAEIVERMAEAEQKADRTVESLDGMYQKAYTLAEACKIPAAMNQAVTGIARLYGMDKDAGGSKDAPSPIADEDLGILRAIAKAVTEAELAKPKLVKNTA